MRIFNMYRRGYELGYADGSQRRRRRPDWEVLAGTPISWLPLVDRQSLSQGYQDGFSSGAAAQKFFAEVRGSPY